MYMNAANCRKVREFGHRLKKLVHFQLEIQQKQLHPLVSEREDVLQQRQQVRLLRFQSFTLKSDSKEKLWSGFRDGRDSADDPCAVLARSVSRNESKDWKMQQNAAWSQTRAPRPQVHVTTYVYVCLLLCMYLCKCTCTCRRCTWQELLSAIAVLSTIK